MKITKTLLLLTLFSNLLIAQKNDWVLKKDRDGVKIYFRESETSKIKELRMVYTLDARLSTVVALLEDAPNFKNWVYALEKASMIERISPYEQYYYN